MRREAKNGYKSVLHGWRNRRTFAPQLKQDLLAAFRELGMQPGMTVMVHTSLSSMGYVCGGAPTVIEALLETVRSEGTIMMPTQSWKNLDPEVGVHPEVSKRRLADHPRQLATL